MPIQNGVSSLPVVNSRGEVWRHIPVYSNNFNSDIYGHEVNKLLQSYFKKDSSRTSDVVGIYAYEDCVEIEKLAFSATLKGQVGVVYARTRWHLQPNLVKYGEYIQSEVWKEKATKAKERAGWRCQLCNIPGDESSLAAHHRTYARLGHELDDDITILCKQCHHKIHQAGIHGQHQPKNYESVEFAFLEWDEHGNVIRHRGDNWESLLQLRDQAIKAVRDYREQWKRDNPKKKKGYWTVEV